MARLPRSPATPEEVVVVAPDTFVLLDHVPLVDVPTERGILPVHTTLIRGAQPVLVDTGIVSRGSTWLERVFELVEPADLRWIVLTHDDPDHAGNLSAVLDACRHATLVTTWIAVQRLAAAGVTVPPDRCRWMDDGDVLDVGDRALVLQRPPSYDAPGTRGVVDTSTGVFLSVDSFAALVRAPAREVADVDRDDWREGFIEHHQWNTPWLAHLDIGWWHRSIDRLADRSLHAIVSSHGPVITGAQVPQAITLLRELPAVPVRSTPDRSSRAAIATPPGRVHRPG